MRKIVLVCFISLLVFNCSKEEDINELLIRIENSSSYDFSNIQVDTNGGENYYGNLVSGEISTYKSFEKAYRYAFIELYIDGDLFTLQPIDYVGETPLKNGKYTYKIDANNSNDQYGRLSLTFASD